MSCETQSGDGCLKGPNIGLGATPAWVPGINDCCFCFSEISDASRPTSIQ